MAVRIKGKNYGLGRQFARDNRDRKFPMAAVLPRRTTLIYRYWYQGAWWGNQNPHPHCVAYSWIHWLEDGPVVHDDVPPPLIVPKELYDEAQRKDEWPGTNYDGTSVRAGAKILKGRGYIKEYRWASSVNDVAQAILTTGPVVVGTSWYEAMFTPDSNYFIKPEGDVVGGHAWLLNGVNTTTKQFRLKNSWGRGWGRTGNAFITFDDFETLLEDDGEACLAVENS